MKRGGILSILIISILLISGISGCEEQTQDVKVTKEGTGAELKKQFGPLNDNLNDCYDFGELVRCARGLPNIATDIARLTAKQEDETLIIEIETVGQFSQEIITNQNRIITKTRLEELYKLSGKIQQENYVIDIGLDTLGEGIEDTTWIVNAYREGIITLRSDYEVDGKENDIKVNIESNKITIEREMKEEVNGISIELYHLPQAGSVLIPGKTGDSLTDYYLGENDVLALGSLVGSV